MLLILKDEPSDNVQERSEGKNQGQTSQGVAVSRTHKVTSNRALGLEEKGKVGREGRVGVVFGWR